MVPHVIYIRLGYIRLPWCKLSKAALIPLTLPSRQLQSLIYRSSPLAASRARSDSRQHCEQLTMATAASASGEKSSSMEESADAEESGAKRPQFGNRFLENPENIFQHNAWDNVSWDPEQLEAAKKKVAENSDVFIDLDRQESYETEADRYWDDFYSQHQNKFFKDRHWLFTEFPELSSDVQDDVSHPGPDMTGKRAVPSIDTCRKTDSESGGEMGVPSRDEPGGRACRNVPGNEEDGALDYPGCAASKRILEVGCGVGNTIYPILRTNADQGLFVYGCDFSSVAVEIVRQHVEYDPKRCLSFVCDVSDQEAAFPFPPGSLDVIVMIFVLSAINPDKFQSTITTLSGLLKPGGLLLFRDYGRYDMAQLRFKKGRCLAENFYVRGDGTRVYFFTQDELRTLFTNAGLTEEQNLIDRRLQVNRGRQLTMYRVWIQCKYKKTNVS